MNAAAHLMFLLARGLFVVLLFAGAAVPARAALTPIFDSPDLHNEPNLLGVNPFPFNVNPSVLETLYGEANLRRVDDNHDLMFLHTGAPATMKVLAKFSGINNQIGFFPQGSTTLDTVVRFSDSRYVGYHPQVSVSPNADGTIDPAVSGPVFALGLHRTVTSLPHRNTSRIDQMVTFEIVGAVGHPDNVIGDYVVAFEDNPNNDADYQDVVAQLSGVVPVPEPSAIVLMTLAVAGGRFRRYPYRKRYAFRNAMEHDNVPLESENIR